MVKRIQVQIVSRERARAYWSRESEEISSEIKNQNAEFA
jgi:hypothetical protein